jgi:hypothetical protein
MACTHFSAEKRPRRLTPFPRAIELATMISNRAVGEQVVDGWLVAPRVGLSKRWTRVKGQQMPVDHATTAASYREPKESTARIIIIIGRDFARSNRRNHLLAAGGRIPIEEEEASPATLCPPLHACMCRQLEVESCKLCLRIISTVIVHRWRVTGAGSYFALMSETSVSFCRHWDGGC